MRDPAGFPILTMRQKSFIKSQRWTAHGGESSEPRQSSLQCNHSLFKQKLGWKSSFLANVNEELSDFWIADCNSTRYSYKVNRGETLIAEVNHNFTWRSRKTKEDFWVEVYPGVDYAIIVALLVIHSENVLNWCLVNV